MVSCHSCGRNITSGTIRCAGCQTPFHLSCSHRHKISAKGVFSVCCGGGNDNSASNFNNRLAASFQTRNRPNNKRRQQDIVNKQYHQQQQNNRDIVNEDDVVPEVVEQIEEDEEEDCNMKYGKIQRTVVNTNMVAQDKDKSVIDVDDGQEDIIEIYSTHDTLNEELDHDDSSEDIIIEEHITNSTYRPTQIVTVKTEPADSNSRSSITLETVWQGISSLQSSIGNISNSLDTVSTHLNTFDPRMNELESKINSIKSTTANFENVQNDVSGLKDQLKNISEELESIKAQKEGDKNLNFSDILIEIKQREMKSCNLIIYNVPEDNLRISQDYSTLDDINKFNDLVMARDNSRAREILNNIPNIDLDELETRRLGRMRDNYCRPLRVALQCHEDVITVMKNKRLVNRQFTVKTDLTNYQREKIKELREELDRVNDSNNPTMTIRFVSGEPKIVPIRRYKDE